MLLVLLATFFICIPSTVSFWVCFGLWPSFCDRAACLFPRCACETRALADILALSPSFRVRPPPLFRPRVCVAYCPPGLMGRRRRFMACALCLSGLVGMREA